MDPGQIAGIGGLSAYPGGIFGYVWAAWNSRPQPRHMALGAATFALAGAAGATLGQATLPTSATTRPTHVPAMVHSITIQPLRTGGLTDLPFSGRKVTLRLDPAHLG
jgi:hypothetical protein